MKTILEQLRETVAERGDLPAVVDTDGTVTTYAELSDLSSRIATYLLEHDISTESNIIIKMPRCMGIVALELGCIKTGAAYIVLPDDRPWERVLGSAEECGSKMIVTPEEYAEMITADPLPESEWVEAAPHDIAFVCYSSGSTGNPKAAIQEYGVYDLIMECETEVLGPYMTNEDGSWHQLRKAHPSTFDFISSAMIVSSAIYHESVLYLPPDDVAHDIEALAQYFRDNEIDYVYMSSSSIRKLQEMENLPLRTTHTGAEVAAGLTNKNFDILNCYSMSELGYIVCGYQITEPLEVPPVGAPLCGAELRLIDKDRNPVDDLGILCVCVPFFRGYFGFPERAKDSFIQFDGKWFFITNDIAEVDEHGVYTIRGRGDETIEIMGELVEPSQVEAEVARLFPELGPVAARGFTDKQGEPFLAVYYLAEEPLPIEEFRDRFVGKAKPYLTPRVFIPVKEFPHTASGKIARRVLDVPISSDFAVGEL